MDLGKYVAVGVLAVIVLAAVTYEAPRPPGAAAAGPRVEGTIGTAGPTTADPGTPAEPEPGPLDQPGSTPAPEPTAAPPAPEAAPAPTTGPAAATSAPEVTPAEALGRYTVKAGQTLSDVAGELLGDRGRWRELARANADRLPDPDRIKAGIELVFPREQVARRAAPTQPGSQPAGQQAAATTLPASAPAAQGGGRTYTVARGDTLYSIAKRELGAGGRWKEIRDLNRLASDTVTAGTALRLPAR